MIILLTSAKPKMDIERNGVFAAEAGMWINPQTTDKFCQLGSRTLEQSGKLLRR